MKILQIHFCNLNSLAGSWSIDLTAQEYSTDGIFAITGPTGAGKTTILDAICLALYGKTPRLERVNKTNNEIMTRQTGECWAEVEFSTARGRFRCHWTQHRSRRSAEGELQPSRHEIVDCSNNKVLESRKKQVEQKVIEVTGMSYEQFTRSILLAQGEFNTFLNARPDERAPILEQITGTEVYSRISQKVHEIRSRNQNLYDRLQAECDGFSPLLPEQVAEIRDRQQELLHNSQSIQKQMQERQKLLEWLQVQEQFKLEITSLEGQLQVAKDEWQQLAPKRRLLERAEQADKLRPAYDRLLASRALQQKENLECEQAAQQLKKLAEIVKEAQAEREQLGKKLCEREAEDRKLEQVFRKVREFDKEIALTGKQYNDFLKERETSLQQQAALVRQNSSLTDKLAKLEKEQSALSSYFSDHKQDKHLVSELSGIEQYGANYLQLAAHRTKLQQQIVEAAKNIEQKAQQVEAQKKQFKTLSSQLAELQQQEQHSQNALAALLSQNSLGNIEEIFTCQSALQTAKYHLEQLIEHQSQLSAEIKKYKHCVEQLDQHSKEQAELHRRIETAQKEFQLQSKAVQQQELVMRLAAKVKNLEEERKKLQEGAPCPLCGATEHPYLSTQAPEIDAEEKQLKQEQDRLETTRQLLNELTNRSAACSAKIEQLRQTQSETQGQIEVRQGQRDQEAEDQGVTIGSNLKQELETRRSQLDYRTTQLQQLQSQCLHLKKTLDALKTKIDSTSRAATEAERALQKQLHEHDGLIGLHEQLMQTHKDNLAQLELQAKVIQDKLNPYLSAELHESELASKLPQLLVELKKRKISWLEAEARDQELAASSQKLSNERTRLETQLSSLQENLDLGQKRLTSVHETLEQLSTRRKELFADNDPDQVEEQRLELKTQLEKRFEELTLQCEQLLREQAKLTERQHGLTQRINERKIELSELADQFTQKLQSAGFANESDYLAATVDPTSLAEQLAIFDARKKEIERLQHLLQNTHTKLDLERQKQLTTLPAPELLKQLEELNNSFTELTKQSGALGQQLKNNEEQQKLHQQKLGQLLRQAEVLEHWSQLHELIGSADGKKFRNFAQGLTFELMIYHANISLQQMTDRYLLQHYSQQPLELYVIDNYQAGEIRSTKNLSGGESFIVSMALALGLSSMASNKVQVDSLFLDEGFGTLDEEALQTALDTLSNLHQNGKLIGVISHISGLQERITTRIQVTKGLGGLSTLTGPGVTGSPG